MLIKKEVFLNFKLIKNTIILHHKYLIKNTFFLIFALCWLALVLVVPYLV